MNGDIDIYYGAASGQQRSALRRLEPEGVIISYATHNNKPFEGDYDLFVDSGGYHHMMSGSGEYGQPDEKYIEYVKGHDPKRWVLRDYPCEPDLLKKLNRTVRQQQNRTTNHHRALLSKIDRDLEKKAVTVLQGWTRGEYLSHLDELQEAGLLTDHVGIGSVCRRGYDREIANIVLTIRDGLPANVTLHAFGVKGSVLRFKEVVDALDSVDSAAYSYGVAHFDNHNGHTWRDAARSYLNWRKQLTERMATESLDDPAQTDLTNYR